MMSEMDDSFIIELRKDFLNEVTFLLEECEESFLKLHDASVRAEELKKIFRLAHSIKGSGTAVGFHDLAKFAHVVEDLLAILRVHPEWVTTEINSLLLTSNDAFKARIASLREGRPDPWNVAELQAQVEQTMEALKKRVDAEEQATTGAKPAADVAAPSAVSSSSVHSPSPAPMAAAPNVAPTPTTGSSSSSGELTTIKVDVSRLESVLDLVGEMVVIKSQLAHHPTIAGSSDNELKALVGLLEKTVRELQDRTLSMRMTPLKTLFLKVQRVIRDLSVKLGKPVEFSFSGDETELDRTMLEVLTDPLIHLARNAVDHGVENPEVRAASGKPATARVSLVARQANGRVVIEITDDGGGISKEKVLAHAKKKGVVAQDLELASLSDREVFEMIFLPGFSTAEKVTDVSGRGVGLDVVKSNIEKIRGSIEIESRPGLGSVFRLSLPFTTAITDGLLTSLAEQRYILPLNGVREIVRLDDKVSTHLNEGAKVIDIRGQHLPLIDLDQLLGRARAARTSSNKESGAAIIVEHFNHRFAMRVDQVLGQTQVVVKGLGQHFDSGSGVSGGAILGDGCVSLVLDLDGLIRAYKEFRAKESKGASCGVTPSNLQSLSH